MEYNSLHYLGFFFLAFPGDLQNLIAEPLESIDLYEKTMEF